MGIPKLIELKEWMKSRFVNPPSMRTAQNWCDKGYVPAKKIGGKWYVYYEQEILETGNELVDRVLLAG